MTMAERGLRRFGPFLVGVLEIVTLVLVARWIGLGWALLLLFLTSIVGFALLRIEGFRAWAALRRTAAEARMEGQAVDDTLAGADPDPSTKIADTGVRILSGVLMTLPGFVTDLFALLLLIPPVRRSMGRRLSAAAFRTFPGRMPGPGGGQGGPGTQHRPVVIKGEVVDTDRDK